jgi:porin
VALLRKQFDGLGVWTYSTTFDHLTLKDSGGSALKTTAYGAYLLMDQAFSQTFSAFLRFGFAAPGSQQFSTNLGAGIVFAGLIPVRPNDKTGLAVAMVTNGAFYREANPTMGTTETALEWNYRMELTPGLYVQPDVQYVISPATDPAIRNALVAAVRLEASI